MSIYIGKYVPDFKFRLNKTYIDPEIITPGATGISTGQFLDANKIQISYTSPLTGTQYNIQIVPETFTAVGINPTVILSSSNTGIAQLDVSNNTQFINTGTFNIVGTYTGVSKYLGRYITEYCQNISGGGNTLITTEYRPDNVQASKHVLVVYNSGSTDSTNLKFYYTGHRPLFSGANILGIACPSLEQVNYETFVTGIRTPIINYLTGVSGSKPIRYIIMMKDIPTRISSVSNINSVSYEISTAYKSLNLRNGNDYQYATGHFTLGEYQGNTCLVSYINFGSYLDCTQYIDKISFKQTGIYLTGNGGNTGYYFEDNNGLYSQILPYVPTFMSGRYLRPILNEFPSTKYIYKPTGTSYITTGNNVAGFATWGANGLRGGNYANDGSIKWGGNNNWYIMCTIESFNGDREPGDQGNFIDWFSGGAFGGIGGTGYNNTPVGAVGHVEEPGVGGVNYTGYFLLWQKGWPFIEAAWQSRSTNYFIAFGDPFVKIS